MWAGITALLALLLLVLVPADARARIPGPTVHATLGNVSEGRLVWSAITRGDRVSGPTEDDLVLYDSPTDKSRVLTDGRDDPSYHSYYRRCLYAVDRFGYATTLEGSQLQEAVAVSFEGSLLGFEYHAAHTSWVDAAWVSWPRPSAFEDVPESHPYADAIWFLQSRGVVTGYGAEETLGEFKPGSPLWRAQFAKMIVEALNVPVEEGALSPFEDLGPNVPDNLYPHEYVAAVYEAGITRGKTATSFAPYEDIPRAQVVTMVVRALEDHDPTLLKTPPASFQGVWGNFSPDHQGTARVADYNGVLDGLGRQYNLSPGDPASLDPWAPMPRGEVAQILWNAIWALARE